MTKVRLKAFALGLIYLKDGKTWGGDCIYESEYCGFTYENETPDNFEYIEVYTKKGYNTIVVYDEGNIDDLIVDTTEAEKILEKREPNKKIVLQGTPSRVAEDRRKLGYEFKHICVLHETTYDDLCVCVVEVIPYSMAEQQEIHIYGDQAHEEYLMSEAYDTDCKMEQWDWLKRENEAMQE